MVTPEKKKQVIGKEEQKLLKMRKSHYRRKKLAREKESQKKQKIVKEEKIASEKESLVKVSFNGATSANPQTQAKLVFQFELNMDSSPDEFSSNQTLILKKQKDFPWSLKVCDIQWTSFQSTTILNSFSLSKMKENIDWEKKM